VATRRVFLDGGQERVEGIGKEFDAIGGELIRDLFHRDACGGQIRHGLAGTREAFSEALVRLAVIAEGIERRRRNGVDCVRADEFFHIDHIAIVGIFCAGARPEDALGLRSFGGEGFPADTGENALVGLVG